MKRGRPEKINGGFSVKATPGYNEKQEREKRMKERKNDRGNGNVTNEEIFEFLQDIADRQSEIYDLLNEK